MERLALGLLVLLVAGCLDAPDANAPALTSDERRAPHVDENTSTSPGTTTMTTPTPTSAVPEPAAVGEWINGTIANARLVEMTKRADPTNENRTLIRYVWDIEYLVEASEIAVRFRPSPAHPWAGGMQERVERLDVEVPVSGYLFRSVDLQVQLDESSELFSWSQPEDRV